MSPLRWVVCTFLVVVLLACSVSAAQGALGASNVLVLYNQASPDGLAIANYYAQAHPGVQLLGVSGLTTSEDISASDYLSVIRPQVASALSSSIDVIVTTKGMPLRITNSASGPSSYVDPFNIPRTVATGYWKQYSSLESELTRIDTISTLNQMGDNYYKSTAGKPQGFPNPCINPYYSASSRPSADFHYSTYYNSNSYNGTVYGGMRLTSRLDGYTVANVTASINRATNAYILPQISQVVVDDDNRDLNQDGVPDFNDLMAPLHDILTSKCVPQSYDTTTAFITSAASQVVGYVSHGVHSGLSSTYVTSQLQFSLGPGAVFETHESYNAYSFQQGGSTMGQGQIAQWLSVGGTVGVGNVEEPWNHPDNEANEDKIFKMLLDGKTWAEAAWSSIRQLSFVTTVVGDPLMTWKMLTPGDANKDGTVGSADLALLGANWGVTGQSGGALWGLGDFNGDGLVGSADLALLGANWGAVASWVSGGGSSSSGSGSSSSDGSAARIAAPPDTSLLPLRAIPEPSTFCLVIAGLAIVLAHGALGSRQRRHRAG
jgi:uncharacterized protein (TIGR03790 family)